MEVLTLKWNNYQNVFSHHISELRKKAYYTDATIACNGKLYNVHKFVLSICSDYFNSIFINTTCKNPFVIIKDVNFKDIEYLLDYMYTGEVNVHQSELASLIASAENLQIKGLAVSDENYLPFDNDKEKNVTPTADLRIGCSSSKYFKPKNNEKGYSNLSSKSDNLFEELPVNIGLDFNELNSSAKHITRILSNSESLKKGNIDMTTNNIPPEDPELLVDLPLNDQVKTEMQDLYQAENYSPLPDSKSYHSECSNFSKEDSSSNFLFQASPQGFKQKEFVQHIEDDANYIATSEINPEIIKRNRPRPTFHFPGKKRDQEFCRGQRSLSFENSRIGFVKKDYKCRYCGRAFSFKTNQMAHERIHTGEKPFQCLYCPLRTALKGNLKNHILTRHKTDWKSIKHLIFPL